MKPGRRVVWVGLAALALTVGLFALRPAFLEEAELALLDWRFRLRGAQAPRTPVVVVAIDDKSVDELGRWPWRRSRVAELIDRLSEAGAAAIVLDIVFSEPERLPQAEPLERAHSLLLRQGVADPEALGLLGRVLEEADTDARLEAAIARSERTVVGYFFRTGEEDSPDGLAPDAVRSMLRRSLVSVARVPAESRAPILTCIAVEPNLPRFHEAARRGGFFSALRDRDGVVRRAPLVARCGDDLYVSLALAAVEVASGARSMVLGDIQGIREVRVGEARFATDEGGRVLVNYRGPAATFPHYPFTDVLHGRVPLEEFADAIVLVGPTEVGIGDIQTTPFGAVFPGVEVHANVIDNLLTGAVLQRDDRLILLELALVIGVGLLVIAVVPRLGGAGRGFLFAGALALLLGVATVWAFVARGLWINLAYPGVTLLGVYLAVAVTQSMTVERRGRMIRRAFATYVPPEVVNEMILRPESFRLGGERRDLSILFSDVRDFTSLSEALGAEATAQLINEYLTPMTEIVFRSRGTLDKYIGDAIVAFWGAPLEVEDHPRRACEAAVAMQEEIERLRRRSDLPGAERLRVGIGIHSAQVVVGNLGSELRFDYTVTGDGVNLCSRLEGLTKYYGVGIIASAALLERLPQGYLTRELDAIRVKGKQEGVRIFEVRGRRAANEQETPFLESYERALGLYREGRWREAEPAFERARELAGGDGPAEALLERMRDLALQPPPDWQGVWAFESK